jgi:hypothetical protein
VYDDIHTPLRYVRLFTAMNGTIRRRPVTTISSTSSSTSIKQNDDDSDDDGDGVVNGRGDDDDGDTLHRRPRRRKINSSISRLTNQVSSVAAARRKKDGSVWSRLRIVDIALFVSITIKLLSFVYYRSNKQRQQTTMTRNDNNHRQPFKLHSLSSSSSLAPTTATNINTTQLFPKWVHRWMMGYTMTFHSPLLYNRGNENEDVLLYSSPFDNDENDDDNMDDEQWVFV